MQPPPPFPEGFRHFPRKLPAAQQRRLLAEVLELVERAGWYRPTMPKSGRPLSVEMCNLGPLGWISDRHGYRYVDRHPVTGRPWPPMPEMLLELWAEHTARPAPPECCLVNLYRAGAKLGLHQDRDEEDLEAPILSLSLGDPAWFRIGGPSRRAPTRRLRLESGDLIVLAGPARLAFHGIDGILPGRSPLVPGGGRINLTLRRVTRSS